jgi:hypothetical protein
MWERIRQTNYGVFEYEPNDQCFCCCEFSALKLS